MKKAGIFALAIALVAGPALVAGIPALITALVHLDVSANGDPPAKVVDVTAGDVLRFEARTSFAESKLYVLASSPGPNGGLDLAHAILLGAQAFNGPCKMLVKVGIPAGLTGQRFVAQAIARSSDGRIAASDASTVRIMMER